MAKGKAAMYQAAVHPAAQPRASSAPQHASRGAAAHWETARAEVLPKGALQRRAEQPTRRLSLRMLNSHSHPQRRGTGAKLEALFAAYESYWHAVGLAFALTAIMAIQLLLDEPEEQSTSMTVTHALACAAFTLSLCGVGLCLLLKAQMGFAPNRESFMRRFARCMDAPSALLLLAGACFVAALCARLWARHPIMSCSVGGAAALGLCVLCRARRAMREHNANMLDAPAVPAVTQSP